MEAKEGARSRRAAAAVIAADGNGDYSRPGWSSGASSGAKGFCWTIDEVEVRVRVYLYFG